MRSLTVALAALLLLAGCINKAPPDEVPGADLEPTDLEPEAVATPATPASPAPASPGAPAPSPAAPSGPAPTNASDVPPPTAVGIGTTYWDGSITGAGAQGSEPSPLQDWRYVEVSAVNDEATFDVPAGLSAIVVELSWTQGQAPADLDLIVEASDVEEATPPAASPEGVATRTGHWWSAADGTPAETTTTATIVLTDAEALALAGTWTWRVVPKGPAHEVAFRVAVSLFTGTLPQDGYSALAPPSGNP